MLTVAKDHLFTSLARLFYVVNAAGQFVVSDFAVSC